LRYRNSAINGLSARPLWIFDIQLSMADTVITVLH